MFVVASCALSFIYGLMKNKGVLIGFIAFYAIAYLSIFSLLLPFVIYIFYFPAMLYATLFAPLCTNIYPDWMILVFFVSGMIYLCWFAGWLIKTKKQQFHPE